MEKMVIKAKANQKLLTEEPNGTLSLIEKAYKEIKGEIDLDSKAMTEFSNNISNSNTKTIKKLELIKKEYFLYLEYNIGVQYERVF